MNVQRLFGNYLDRPATDPLLEEPGFWWEIRAGQILDPISDPDGRFNPIPPDSVLRATLSPLAAVAINLLWLMLCTLGITALWVFSVYPLAIQVIGSGLMALLFVLAPIPGRFVSWRIGDKAGYSGCKIYGVDDPNYVPWAGAENVYPGSLAMHFSVRLMASV